MQTTFVRQTFDELNRLGLRPETETLVRERDPEQTGMLTVQQVIPGSPADERLEPGDILLRVNGELVTGFVPLAAILDNAVDEPVTLELERGGQRIVESLPVTDLHAITPDEFLEFGDAIVNNLSYQQARHYNSEIEGVYVANPGYMLARAAIPRGAIITELGGEPVANITDLEDRLARLADRERSTVRFRTIDDPRNSAVRSIEMDRTWFPARRCARNDDTGVWPCRDLAPGPADFAPPSGSTRFPSYDDRRVDVISHSLVMVNFDLPYTISGVAERHYYGTGLVVDTQRGLVVVDRNTVPVAMGDVSITFAGSLQIRGTVEFIHPLHNLAVVSYDPALIGDTPVRAARFDTSGLESGERTWAVGLKSDHQVAHQASTVASIEPLTLPLSRTMRFRDSNIEGISLVTGPDDFDGVLVNKKGEVQATWSSFAIQSGSDSSQFSRGISSSLVSELVDVVRSGRPIYSLEAEVGYAPLFAARKLGLDEEWLHRLRAARPAGSPRPQCAAHRCRVAGRRGTAQRRHDPGNRRPGRFHVS
ncbi:MAG: PDZ domain-containing protein [Woeseiaceae bacterium]|nr:PDZ domain-containing protein [Woeseiaceae bacterium]